MHSAARSALLQPYFNPNTNATFDESTKLFSSVKDYAFGTANAPAGAIQISDATTLAANFNPFSNNTTPSDFVINFEFQRYQQLNSANHAFVADALELTATFDPSSAPAIATKTTTADVANSRVVALDSVTGLKAGQIVSFGSNHVVGCTRLFGLRTTLTAGNTAKLIISHTLPSTNGGFDPITIQFVIDGSTTFLSLSQAFVDAVNGDATLASFGISAYKHPDDPSCYAITYPPKPSSSSQGKFGKNSTDSLGWVAFSASAIGSPATLTHETRGTAQFCYIHSISGNNVTLNYPVTQPSGSTFYANPCYAIMRNSTFSGSSTTIPLNDTSMITVGQVLIQNIVNLIYRVTAVTGSTVTVDQSASVLNGDFLIVSPMFAAVSSVLTSNSTIFSFAAVPAGIKVGMAMMDITTTNSSTSLNTGDWRVTAINRGSTPQTVTINTVISKVSGNKYLFYPAVQSAQIWSKTLFSPGRDGYKWLAIEYEVDFPDMRCLGAWPATWLFVDPTDPDPGPTLNAGATSEIDITDTFYYFMNTSLAAHRVGGNQSIFYINPTYMNSNQTGGNNLPGTHKMQMIWSPTKTYFYMDGILLFAANTFFKISVRSQLAVNLAVGSKSQVGNGFFPLEFSQFPMKMRLKRLRVLGLQG